jgi:putative cardiolipin synthase
MEGTSRAFIIKIFFGLMVLGALICCQSIPKSYPRPDSYQVKDTSKTYLGKSLAGYLKKHPRQSGMIPLASGTEALSARLSLAGIAEQTLDLQYYIWHSDLTGKVVMEKILDAADRGVRVRLLVDDLHEDDFKEYLLAMSEHPQIQVRLFNPAHNRSIPSLDFFTRLSEANRRMHNKAFIVDNQVAIVGGRNIGDEYFEASQDLDFGDFDIASLGPVVPEVSDSFDAFWNHPLSVPISVLVEPKKMHLPELRQALKEHYVKFEQSQYSTALQSAGVLANIRSGETAVYWGEAVALWDTPEKIYNKNKSSPELLANQLSPHIRMAKKEIFLISPYYVPGDEGVANVAALVGKGVTVKILTNSLASSDVSVVQRAYSGYRKDLLGAGAELYEIKEHFHRKNKHSHKIEPPGASRAGLHGKAYFIDDEKIFVGSMNLDPRSLYLNTELGLIIRSPDLAEQLAEDLEDRLGIYAYRLSLNAKKDVVWTSFDDGDEITFTTDPETSWWKRFYTDFISLFVPEAWL